MGCDARQVSAAHRGRTLRPGCDETRRGGCNDCGGLSWPDLAAKGQSRPCFRHGRWPFHLRCGVAADRRSARAGGATGGHSGSRRTRAFHRARAYGGDRRAGRAAHRRAALTQEGRIDLMIAKSLARITSAAMLAACLLCTPALAQQPPPASAIAAARELVELKGGAAMFDPVIVSVIEQTKAA